MNIWRHELTDLPLSSRAYWYSFASIEFHKATVRLNHVTKASSILHYPTGHKSYLLRYNTFSMMSLLWFWYSKIPTSHLLSSVWYEVTTLAGIFPPIISRSWRLLYSVIDWIRILVNPTGVVTSYQTKGRGEAGDGKVVFGSRWEYGWDIALCSLFLRTRSECDEGVPT
jgi:hypothetical protein